MKTRYDNYNDVLIDFFAYLINYNKKISVYEFFFIFNYFSEKFNNVSQDKLYEDFIKALNNEELDFNAILTALSNFTIGDYKAKLKLVMLACQLLMQDRFESSESNLIEKICTIIGIQPVDTDLLLYICEGKKRILTYPENENNIITIGESSDYFDLNYKGIDLISFSSIKEIKEDKKVYDITCKSLDLIFFYLNNEYYLLNYDSKTNVLVDDYKIHLKRIVSLKDKKNLYFEDKTIPIELISEFRNNKINNLQKIISFKYENDKLYIFDDTANADFVLDINKNIIKLIKNKNSNLDITINGYEPEEKAYINIADYLIFNKRKKILVLDLIKSNNFSLTDYTSKDDTIIISNNIKNATYYLDEYSSLGKEIVIKINIRKKEDWNYFEAYLEKVPIKTEYVDNKNNRKTLNEKDKLTLSHNEKLIVGCYSINFNCFERTITLNKINFELFEIKNLLYRFKNGNIGIDNISFKVHNGELIGIMGASGAGKTTLLQILLGYLKPQSGEVKINNIDFFENFDCIKKHIGYVPQDDLLLENLTVWENLIYAAKLRMPDKSKKEIEYLVENTLRNIGLLDKKDLKVGSPVKKVLSGGQRKRLNIGLELVSNPDLFFLDEPTSGLSSKDSEMIIDLLHHIAKQGKMVFVVIHQPSSDIYKKFTKLLLLDTGGKLAYFGDRIEAIKYFKEFSKNPDDYDICPLCGNANPELIFDILESKETGLSNKTIFIEKEQSYEGILYYITKFLKIKNIIKLPKRLYSPDFWKRLFYIKSNYRKPIEKKENVEISIENKCYINFSKNTKKYSLKILLTLISRSFKEKISDISNIIMTFAAPSFLGFFLSYLMIDNKYPYLYFANKELPKYFFLTIIIFIFFGLMASITQVIKDRPILLREKIVNIKAWQYLLSKSLVFILFSLIQSLIYTTIGFMILKIPVEIPSEFYYLNINSINFFWYFFLVCFITSFTSYSFGLMLSSYMKSESASFYLIVIIVVLQIVLGGMFVDYEKMDKGTIGIEYDNTVPVYCNVIFSRWGYESLLSGSEILNPINIVLKQKYLNSDERDKRLQLLNSLKEKTIERIPAQISYDTFKKRILDVLDNKIEKEIKDYNYLINKKEYTNLVIIYKNDSNYNIIEENDCFNLLFYQDNNYNFKLNNDINYIKQNDYLEKIEINDNNLYITNLSEPLSNIIYLSFYKDQITKYYKYTKIKGKKFYLLTDSDDNHLDLIRDIFVKVNFYNIYSLYDINESVKDLTYGKNYKDFPSNDKNFFGLTIDTIIYNNLVLILFSIIFNIITIRKLKKL